MHNYIEGQKTAKGQEKPKKQDKPESVSNKNDTKKKLLDTAAPSMPPETRGNSRETVSEDKLKDPINGHMRFNGEHFTFSDPTRDRTDPDSRHTGGFYDNERGRALLKERIEEIARKGAIFASRKNGETYKPDEAAEALKSGGDIVIIPPEKEVSEESEEEKRQSRSESMRGNKNAYKGGGEEGQRKTRLGLRAQDKGKEARKKEGHAAEEKPILKDNIHTILHGTPEEKEKLQQSFFYMAKTPEFMKDIGLSGDYFSVRFGVVSRHERKDEDHNLTEQNWIDLTEAITKPFAIAKHGEGFRLFTGVKTNGKFIAVGVDVKNIGKGIEVNSVSTVFGKTPPAEGIKDVIYRGKKITPEQAALLEGPNSPSYPPVGAIPSVSPETGEKSSEFAKIQEKYRSAKSVTGDEDEIQVGKEVLSGMWKLVEADTPTASHDETDFHKTPGFPTTDDGATINDRDYGHDREAQEIVMEIGSDYDGRAVSVDNPVIVTKDGIVISGNNRTMSSKIAARKGTD
ncbi:MAG: hypothetical protein LBD29_05825, partial [Treponema sp.]|nr:hypothetical protein [Treponema sp.]